MDKDTENKIKKLELDMKGYREMFTLYCYFFIASFIGFFTIIPEDFDLLDITTLIVVISVMLLVGLLQYLNLLFYDHKKIKKKMLFNFIWYSCLFVTLFIFLMILQIILPHTLKILNLKSDIGSLNLPFYFYLLLALIGGSVGSYIFYLDKFNKTKDKIKKII